jgi:asparagine synthase (glutamine-hydrolysing)
MCGISGMFGSPEPSIVKSMTLLQHHRGPDGKGIWNDEHISLGHSRLAIVDLEGSQQPITSDHGCILVVNGEIYNYQQLRQSNQSILGRRWVIANLFLHYTERGFII